jgi:UPF0271 protein
MINNGTVKSTQGTLVNINPGTICIHGDGAHAVEFAKAIHETLTSNGIILTSPISR